MSSSTYTVERSATIAAEPQRIYDRLVDFHEWMQWSPWEDLDPDRPVGDEVVETAEFLLAEAP